jgi:hypothetical protein
MARKNEAGLSSYGVVRSRTAGWVERSIRYPLSGAVSR